MPDSQDIKDAAESGAFQQTLKVAFELHNAGHHADAEAVCRVLLRLNERDVQLLFLLGMILHKLGRSGDALKYLETAAELEPQATRIFNGLGFVQNSLKDHASAVKSYTRAIELGLRAADTFYSLGNACYQLGQLPEAVKAFQSAVELKPKDAESWNNLGKCLGDLGRLAESIQAYDRALALDTNYALARYGRALVLLTAGQLETGLPEYNQWRHHGLPKRELTGPAWRGEMIPGKTLFLHAEQGFGDAIQHVRHVREARARAGRVILECRPELKTLFTHSSCADVVIAYGEAIPPYDYFAPLPSLPGILGVTLTTIPQTVPYLKAGPHVELPPAPAKNLKVGIAWAGNPSHHNNAARSIRLVELAPLFCVPGVSFYSLQAVMPPKDEYYFGVQKFLLELPGQLNDFLETSRVVAQLDLIIAVDTAVAHLAGALAKPVWTLLPYAADWRWFRDRTDTPWYPTMRLFRQPKARDWRTVLHQVAGELERLTAGKI